MMELNQCLCALVLVACAAMFLPIAEADDNGMNTHMNHDNMSMPMNTTDHSTGHPTHMSHDNMSMPMNGTDHSGHGHGGPTDNGDTDHSGHEMDNTGHGGHTSAHPAYFFAGVETTILFVQWTTRSWQGLLGSCIALLFLAALYEGFKVLREDLFSKQVRARKLKKARNCGQVMCSGGHMLQSLLHIIQVLVSYVLMLVFMTFNVYLCLAVVLGAGIGYYFFAWRRTLVTDINEHCV